MPPRDYTSTPTLDPITDITRRRLLAAIPALGLIAAGVSCGDDDDGASGETRRVEDHFGTVTIPRQPRRVVSADDITLATMISLGAKPIASYVNPLSPPAYLGADSLSGVQDITNPVDFTIDLERALALDPDLIITVVGVPGDLFYSDLYKTYQAAVPTFGFLRDDSSLAGIRKIAVDIARALDLEDKADEVMDGIEKRVADLRQEFQDVENKKVAIVRIWPDFLHLRYGDAAGVLLQEMGLEWAVEPESPDAFALELSLEQLNLLDGAGTVFLMINSDAGEYAESVRSNPVWQSLEVVKQGRVIEVDSGPWIAVDATALHVVLEDVANALRS